VIRRPRRGLTATIAALVLLAACALTATIAVQLIAGQRPLIRYRSIADIVHRAHWNGTAVGIAGGVAMALGLILLLAALIPGAPTVLPVEQDGTGIDAGASRRSLRSTLRTAAGDVDGVTSAKLRLRRHRIAAKVRTDAHAADDLTEAVKAAIEHRLDQVSPVTRPTLRLRVKTSRTAP
jgi:Family of unknown function (DUF6286)